MPSTSPPTFRRRRALFGVALVLTLSALIAPAVVTVDESYTLSYVGVDYEADAVQDTAYFWASFGEHDQSTLQTARREGSVSVTDRSRFVDGPTDSRFSVVRDDTVYQYRLDHSYDPWWYTYRTEALLVGFVATLGALGWGAVRSVDTVFD